MKNLKFVEFITKYDALYNSLSKEDKELIFDLDEYDFDLFLYENSNEKIKYYSDAARYYFYIGKKDNYYYYLVAYINIYEIAVKSFSNVPTEIHYTIQRFNYDNEGKYFIKTPFTISNVDIRKFLK